MQRLNKNKLLVKLSFLNNYKEKNELFRKALKTNVRIKQY
jgi:hypothetical protein